MFLLLHVSSFLFIASFLLKVQMPFCALSKKGIFCFLFIHKIIIPKKAGRVKGSAKEFFGIFFFL